jgi:hypothetical protein
MARKLLAALALVGTVCLIARSAPILPGDMHFSDEIRTTAGIGAVRLIILPFPPPFVNAGISRNRIWEDWKKQLEQNRIQVFGKGDVPVLKLFVHYFKDESLPGAVGYVCFLTLEQRVTIPRLEKSYTIPTWTGCEMGMKPMSELAPGFRATLSLSIGKFLSRARQPRSGNNGPVSK